MLPFLKSVPDQDGDAPKQQWLCELDVGRLEEKLRSLLPNMGKLLFVNVISRSASDRAREMLVAGTSAAVVLSGEAFRLAAGLPSACFNIGIAPGRYLFEGRGNGHGLGMSQWGARSLALAGWRFEQILAYYYKDVAVEGQRPQSDSAGCETKAF